MISGSPNPKPQTLNPKLRVAQVITRMDWGGAPDIVRILCENLNPDKFELTLICGKNRCVTKKNKKFLEDFKQQAVSIPYLQRDINPFFDLCALIKLFLLFKKEKFDIVHTHTAKAGFLGRVAAHFAGIKKIVHTTHGHNFYGYFGPLTSKLIIGLESYAAKFTDKMIALTCLEKEDLVRFKIIDSQKIKVLNTAVEIDDIKDGNNPLIYIKEGFGVKSNEILIGMVSRLEPIKGVKYFIAAAKIIADKFEHVKFVIVGEGSLKKDLEENITKAGLGPRFIFTGWRDDVLDIIAALDIMVLASLNEAVGIVLIEAQAQGVPVIATRVGGIPEVVEDGKTGILVASQNTEELIKAMQILIEDRQKRQAMSRAGSEAVKNKYSVQSFVDNVSKIYEELIKK